jgi:CPA2 family monovalent cation:H+ antiporter-2
MVKSYQNERLFPGDDLRHRYGCTGQFKTYLHQHEFEALKILKTEITLQQLELNKEELIGKVSANHIREKRWYGRGYRTKRERLLNRNPI